MSSLMDSDLLSDLAEVLGNDVLFRLDDVMKISDALMLSHVSGVSLNEVLGFKGGLVAGFHSDDTLSDIEERLRWMNALDSFLDEQGIPNS